MYYAHWVIAIISAIGGYEIHEVTREIEMTRPACEDYIKAHEATMPDYFRGYAKEDPDAEILVRGDCKPVDERGL